MRFPVSYSQQRLWFLDQLEPGEPTFNMPYAMWLNGPLDPPALERAVGRHRRRATSSRQSGRGDPSAATR